MHEQHCSDEEENYADSQECMWQPLEEVAPPSSPALSRPDRMGLLGSSGAFDLPFLGADDGTTLPRRYLDAATLVRVSARLVRLHIDLPIQLAVPRLVVR